MEKELSGTSTNADFRRAIRTVREDTNKQRKESQGAGTSSGPNGTRFVRADCIGLRIILRWEFLR